MLRYCSSSGKTEFVKSLLKQPAQGDTGADTFTPTSLRYRVCKIQDWRCQLPGAAAAFLALSLKKRIALALYAGGDGSFPAQIPF